MKKQILVTILFVTVILFILVIGMDRVERINNGSMILVNENERDR